MAAYNKFNTFGEQLGLKAHNLNTDALFVYLALAAPDAEADAVAFTDLAEFAGGTGYTARGIDTLNTWSRVTTTSSLVPGLDPVWTAGAAWTNAFRYIVLFNETHATDGLIGWWDYASNLNLANGETFTVDFGSSIFTLA